MSGEGDSEALRAQVRALRDALEEANETLDAIRNGDVDAVVVGGPVGQIVYTLENADRPYRVLVEQMKEGAVTLAPDGTILYCNSSFAALVGRRPAEIVGGDLFSYVRERESLAAMLGARTAGASAELTILTAPGGTAPANVSVVELVVEKGAERVLCGIVTDLTHNYQRARELGEANERLAAEIVERTKAEQSLAIALDAADMGSWNLSLQGGAPSRSPRHANIFGHQTLPEPWGMAELIDHFVPEDREAVAAAFAAAQASGVIDVERRIHRAGDGALRWIHIKGRTFHGDGGPERIAGVVIDVTDRRMLDEQRRQSQKMEAIGQLTGGIAHDFNNLLMIIGGSLEALSRRVRLEGRVQTLLDAARLGVARGAKLNEQLLAFARRQDMNEEVVCINDLLPDFETLLDRAVGESVVVDVVQDPDLWYCRTDPHQLETAILNLAINARDAMGAGGTLRVSTGNLVLGAAEAKRREADPGDYVLVSVADTGCGMNADVIARVFEPFFTTKGIGKGTGLGLSQVYGFATQSGGFVSVDSVVGQGTTVQIHLPRVHELRTAREAAGAAQALERASGVVLLVEDDPGVRAASRAMLEDLGYSVREASSGLEALEALSADRAVDIVFSDVIMASGMTGIELAQVIRRKYPTMPVLLTSGYTAQRLVPTALNQDTLLLRKPYTTEELAAGIARTIEAPRRLA
jgi:PAS domain S-box-containing protein